MVWSLFSIYTELADQYKIMDAASNVVKRNVLAQHLREVIDVLEQRVRRHS
jgi:Centrosome microtubule-binding domain of Cep57